MQSGERIVMERGTSGEVEAGAMVNKRRVVSEPLQHSTVLPLTSAEYAFVQFCAAAP